MNPIAGQTAPTAGSLLHHELDHLFIQTHAQVEQLLQQLRQECGAKTDQAINQLRNAPELESSIVRQAQEQIQESARIKDKFVTLVAHDLKSPLAAMIGLIELAMDETSPPLSAEQRELLGHAVRSGRDMSKMITNLLNLNRLRSGKVTIQPHFFNARRLGEAILQRVTPLASGKGIHLKNEIAVHTRLYGDRDLLGEVVQNILTNAIKFSRPGETVIMRWEENPPEGMVGLQVCDQGIGVPPELLPLLFRVEEKSNQLGTAGETGTGFGLPYSRDLMRAHQGDLLLDSEQGHGATATMRLPMVRPKILVVDDLRTARTLFCGYLRSLDTHTLEAVDGQDGLLLAQRELPHMILSDIIMPNMDGFELLSRLKENPDTRHIPVVMVTTDDSIETRDRAFHQGAIDFVVKPVILCDFIPRIRNIIG